MNFAMTEFTCAPRARNFAISRPPLAEPQSTAIGEVVGQNTDITITVVMAATAASDTTINILRRRFFAAPISES